MKIRRLLRMRYIVLSAALLSITLVNDVSAQSGANTSGYSTLRVDSSGTVIGVNTRTLIFVKGNKFRIENPSLKEKVITIGDGKNSYLFYPDKNFAYILPGYQKAEVNAVPSEFFHIKNVAGAKYVGQQTVDGKLCDVYEYSQQDTRYKVYIDKGSDFPLQFEIFTQNGNAISKIQKDIPLDNSLFILPKGTEIRNMTRQIQPIK